MSTRTAAVSLREAWEQPDLLKQIVAGTLQLKLPIAPSEYPIDILCYGGRSNAHPTGAVGWENLYLLGPYLISELAPRGRRMYYGADLGSKQAALAVFAERVSEDDQVREEEREIQPFYGNNHPVIVHSVENEEGVRYHFDERWWANRKHDAKGHVLCRALVNKSDHWIVSHGPDEVAVYTSREIATPPEDQWIRSADLYEFTDARQIDRKVAHELLLLMTAHAQKAKGILMQGSLNCLIDRHSLVQIFREEGLDAIEQDAARSDRLFPIYRRWLEYQERVYPLL